MRVTTVNLELIIERFRMFILYKSNFTDSEKEKLCNSEIFCDAFTQTWGSTSLGFNGVGGSAMTTDYTVVCNVEGTDLYGVFFGERLAYVVNNPNDSFYNDKRERYMAAQWEVDRYDSDETNIFRIQYIKQKYVIQ